MATLAMILSVCIERRIDEEEILKMASIDNEDETRIRMKGLNLAECADTAK